MCRKQLLWLELNLPRKSFEVIYDHIEKGDLVVRSVKLLRGVDDKLDIDFLKEFEAFKEDLRLRKIRAELRVYLDRKIFKLIHARYFYSLDDQGKEIAFQVPPINSLSLDAWDSISPVTKVPPFDSLWRSRSSVDILKDWAKVKDAVAKHLQNKELEQSRTVLANLRSAGS